MATKKLKPMTPGTRHRIAPVFDDVTTRTPEPSLTSVVTVSLISKETNLTFPQMFKQSNTILTEQLV
jgi:ribosomal protein L2